MREHLGHWFQANPKEAWTIAKKAQSASIARQAARKAREASRKSLLERNSLPGKLKDCQSNNPAECEVFIVEGDSAGGSATRGRDPRTQAILPIRGKILNVEKARLDRALGNQEVQALITAFGTGIGEDFNVEKLRYHKIIIMADADVDGQHIRTLLLTLLFRYMSPLSRAVTCTWRSHRSTGSSGWGRGEPRVRLLRPRARRPHGGRAWPPARSSPRRARPSATRVWAR